MSTSSLQHGLTLINPAYSHVLEFGVWQGATLCLIVHQLSYIPYESRPYVYGFDSFEGLPEDWPGTVCGKGFFSANGKIPNVPGAKIIPGWFTDSLPVYLKEAQPIALLHLDCDLYSSTKEVLWALNPFILSGTIIVCDEWLYHLQNGGYADDQEQRAVWDWVGEFNREIEYVPFEDHSNAGNEHRILRVL